MKSKRKNDKTPFVKTPVGSCLVNLLTLSVLGIVCYGVILVLHVLVWIPYQHHLFIQRNTPIVQESVIEQCDITDYQAGNYFNDSSFDLYSDRGFSPEIRIACQQDNYPHGDWNCTCEERTND